MHIFSFRFKIFNTQSNTQICRLSSRLRNDCDPGPRIEPLFLVYFFLAELPILGDSLRIGTKLH